MHDMDADAIVARYCAVVMPNVTLSGWVQRVRDLRADRAVPRFTVVARKTYMQVDAQRPSGRRGRRVEEDYAGTVQVVFLVTTVRPAEA